MIWTKCQNILRWSGQNANQKVGTDKMPTTGKSPDKMPTLVGIMSGWHFVRLAFCPTTLPRVTPSLHVWLAASLHNTDPPYNSLPRCVTFFICPHLHTAALKPHTKKNDINILGTFQLLYGWKSWLWELMRGMIWRDLGHGTSSQESDQQFFSSSYICELVADIDRVMAVLQGWIKNPFPL